MYQSVGDSVVLGSTEENNLSNYGENKVDWDVLAKVVQCVSIKKQSPSLYPSHNQLLELLL